MITLGALALNDPGYERLLAQQGVEAVVATYDHHPAYRRGAVDPIAAIDPLAFEWGYLDLVRLRQRFADAGLNLIALEGAIPERCHDRIMLGLPGRDEQIDAICRFVENMGRAGIRKLGYAWMINRPGQVDYSWRTSFTTPGRGGARVGSFDARLAAAAPPSRASAPSGEELWGHYAHFLTQVLPVAEEAGVQLCIHPDDPPVPELGSLPRLFHDVDGHRRAMAIGGGSPANGILLCLGNWTAMQVDLDAVIEEFGAAGRIGYVHVQALRNEEHGFAESFVDEGDLDFPHVIRALASAGFDGLIEPQHVPMTDGDNWRQDHQILFALGYLRGVLDSTLGRRWAPGNDDDSTEPA